MSEDCIFCKIIDKKIPSQIIHEDKNLLIFKDISPQAKTHYLAIPKTHYKNFREFLGTKDYLLFMDELKVFLDQNQSLNEFRLVSNIGESAGQSVFHVHFHLLGGEKLSSFGA